MSHGEPVRWNLLQFPLAEILIAAAIILGAGGYAVIQGNAIRKHRANYIKHGDSNQSVDSTPKR